MSLFLLKEQLIGAVKTANPTVFEFNNPTSSGKKLVERIKSVNVNRPTDLCKIMKSYKSDKGIDRHNYTTVYDVILKDFKDQKLDVFELGLGTNNPDLPSTMGVAGKPGASLRGWREYFSQSKIVGADIDKDILFEEERINTYFCDQLDSDTIRNMWSKTGDDRAFDVLLEDGLHTFDANISFFENSIQRLKKGGFYIIEDVEGDEIENWKEKFSSDYSEKYPNLAFVIVLLPPRHGYTDNNVIVIFENAQ